MADEKPSVAHVDNPSPAVSPAVPRASGTAPSFSFSSSPAAALPATPPPGHAFRRAATIDETSQFRRRPPLSQLGTEASFDSPRRRSSNFSDYSLGETRKSLRDSTDDILNPRGTNLDNHDGSTKATLPLAFALLPALGGVLFQNGSAIITDVMLLGLAAIFLRYTVMQPWQWYHAAQEVRVREEMRMDLAVDDDSEGEYSPRGPPAPPSVGTLDDVPEEGSPPAQDEKPAHITPRRTRSLEAALNELYIHEVLALGSCFICPVIGAYLLHTLRAQLSRPSEGLVNNFNISIFLLAAELHPLSHAMKLIQARTLHLQRVVNANPYRQEEQDTSRLEEMTLRLQELESRVMPENSPFAQNDQNTQNGNSSSKGKQEAAMVREVRNAIQPELDALNRAVRRYEKKATVLAFQTESRLAAIDTRLNDAISLAAAAAKNSHSQWNIAGWLMEWVVLLILLPFQSLIRLVALPFRTVSAVLFRKKPQQEQSGRGSRNRKSASHSRPGSDRDRERERDRDRVPSRLPKR